MCRQALRCGGGGRLGRGWSIRGTRRGKGRRKKGDEGKGEEGRSEIVQSFG